MVTNLGNIEILLHSDIIPIACENFIELSKRKYFDKSEFFRLIKNILVQGGVQNKKEEDEYNDMKMKGEFDLRMTHKEVGMVGLCKNEGWQL